MSTLDELNSWANEDDESREPTNYQGLFSENSGRAFKARGHGTWAWKKGMRADRGAKSVIDHRDEKHVWLAPKGSKRRKITLPAGTRLRGTPVVITLEDLK